MGWPATSPVNQQYGANGEAFAVYALVYTYLQTLGYTISRCGDGLAIGGAGDLLTSGGVGAGGLGNPDAWFVIRDPAGVEYLLQFDTGGPSGWTYKWTFVRDHLGAFAGGGPAVRATSLSEHGVPADPVALINLFQFDGGLNSRYHMLAADAAVNGRWPWCLLKIHATTGAVLGYMMTPALHDGDAGDTDPQVTIGYGETVASSSWLAGARRARAIYDPAGVATWDACYADRSDINGFYRWPGAMTAPPDGIHRAKRIGFCVGAGAIWKGRSDLVWNPVNTVGYNHIFTDAEGVHYLTVETAGAGDLLIPGWPNDTTCPLPDLGAGIQTHDLIVIDAAATVDTTPPTITIVSPTVGGPITAGQPIVVDVTDDIGLGLVVLTVEQGSAHEVVWLRDAFASAYSDGSTRAAIAGGYRYTVQRRGGWISSPIFHVEAIDLGGNLGA